MTIALRVSTETTLTTPFDLRSKVVHRLKRPAWIPPEITENWDPSPYAYQTEEELVPAGGLHGELLFYIVDALKTHLEQKGFRFLIDVFMLYRDKHAKKRRVAPDLLLMPFSEPLPSSYDLDIKPPPLCVV